MRKYISGWEFSREVWNKGILPTGTWSQTGEVVGYFESMYLRKGTEYGAEDFNLDSSGSSLSFKTIKTP